MVERVSTGIPGLDELIQGGFPKNSVVLVTGGAGTGKTIFCSQYLVEGLKKGEAGLFVTLEEEPNEIKADAEEFGWDLNQFVSNDLFKIEYMNPLEGSGFERRIEDSIYNLKAKRVVIDSTSVMGMHTRNIGKIRERLYNLIRKLRHSKVTSLLTTEIPADKEDALSRFGVEEFVSDGVIRLSGFTLGATDYRSLQILKMRRTEIEGNIIELKITNKGLALKPSEEL